jgi:hypothetical protein
MSIASKPAGKARPELWETSRKCPHGPVKEIFPSFEEEMALHFEISEIKLVRKANGRVQHLSPGPYGRF